MRAAVVVVASLLGACTPEVISGSYLCGPEEACPEGQACNAPDNVCVLASSAIPVACAGSDANDTIDTALALPTPNCVSQPYIQHDCLAEGDAQDWMKFHVMPACSSKADLELSYPIAFEPLAFELWTGGSMIAADSDCAAAAVPGYESRCISMPVNADADYAIVVKPAGGGDCDGKCAFNRYNMTLQLSSR